MVYRIDNRKKKHNGRYVTIVIILGIIVGIGGTYLYENYQQLILKDMNQVSKEITIQVDKTEPIRHIIQQDRVITEQTNDVGHPLTYSLDNLKQMTLDDINNYRKQSGVPEVSLSNAKATQIWSDHLLSEGCITHREGQSGPMQRYLDNGDNLKMVYENISGGYGTQWATPIEAIKQANYDMMNNDMDQNNAHRDNLLNPNHKSVSIGISYDSNKLILVEDFQEPLVANWKSFDLAYDDIKSCW